MGVEGRPAIGSRKGCPCDVTRVKPNSRNLRSRIGVLIIRGLARETTTLWCGRPAHTTSWFAQNCVWRA